MSLRTCCLVLLPFGLLSATAANGQKLDRDQLGRDVRLTILVDKVMLPEEKWIAKEWMIQAAAEAGFNVFSPRSGADRLDEVRQVAQWCAKHGIFHLPWMRGSLSSPKSSKVDGQRLTWANGDEQDLWSPNTDAFWDWTTRYVLEYAKISRECPSLIGVFLDYENYAKGKQGNLYSISYDMLILDKFAQSKNLRLPAIEPAQRKAWLVEQGLDEAFVQFQIAHWRQRCRTLRQAVDAVNPKFQFCIYPAPGTPFMVQAIYPEWATQQAPLILADATTYGRPGRFISEQDALEKNKQRLLKNIEVPKQAGIPFIYTGGIDPAVRGADPEFSGKNAVAISEVTRGYWIFYEGPHYRQPDHAAYWKWFTWANRAIARGDFQAQHQPRETPENWSFSTRANLDWQKLVAPPPGPKPVDLPPVQVRGESLVLLACKARQEVELGVKVRAIGGDQSRLIWEVRDPAGNKVGSSLIASNTTGTISFVPPVDGNYMLIAAASRSTYTFTRSNVSLGLDASDRLGCMGRASRLYFHVPKGLKQFSLLVKGSGAETVRVNVYDPAGKLAASAQTLPTAAEATLDVPTAKQDGATWSLEAARADQGTLEDYALRLRAGLPGILSLRPEHVFAY